MNTRSFDAAIAGKPASVSMFALIAAWFARSLRKSNAGSWADGARGM